MVRKSEFFGDVRHNTYFSYDSENRQTMVGTSLSKRRYTYDSYGRLSQRTSSYNDTATLTETFGYDSASRVSTLRKVLTENGVSSTVTLRYTYDDNGNILSISDGTHSTSYAYDSANQLIRENNQAANKTWVWTYDDAGNILCRGEYAYTTGTIGSTADTGYIYGDSDWGDLLTGYDGYPITYDSIGNPLSDGKRTYTWEHGRELATVTQDEITWTNTYGADGLRTKRTDGTTTYRYRYTAGQLATMNIDDDVEMWFMYDDNGPLVIKYGNAESHKVYHYELNLQGDVIAIISTSGERVVEYTYDAWGNVLSITGSAKDTIGVNNPLRYRGYIYDPETQLYYCQSRYYNPEIGRWLNEDAFASTGQGLLGNNMFAYCGNNPVSRADYLGESFAVIVGFNFNIFGWGAVGSINFVSTEEDFGVQYSYYLSDDNEISKKANKTIGVDLGLYVGVQYTDKKRMSDLTGLAKATGGDLFLGFDVLTEEDGDYLGWQFGSSSYSANMHSLYTNTETLFSIPTINIVQILLDWIFGGE